MKSAALSSDPEIDPMGRSSMCIDIFCATLETYSIWQANISRHMLPPPLSQPGVAVGFLRVVVHVHQSAVLSHRMLSVYVFSVMPSVTLATISNAAIKCRCVSHAPSFPGHHTVSVSLTVLQYLLKKKKKIYKKHKIPKTSKRTAIKQKIFYKTANFFVFKTG